MISLITILVLVTARKANMSKSHVTKQIPHGCKKIDYNVERHGRGDGRIGLLGLNRISSDGFKEVYDLRNGTVLKRFELNTFKDFFSIVPVLQVVTIDNPSYHINGIVPGGCYYRIIETYRKGIVNTVYFYVVLKRMFLDLFDVLSSRQSYVTNIQWKIDMLIKVTKAVQYLHGLGFYHRDIRPENILVDRPIKDSLLNPVLTHFNSAVNEDKFLNHELKESFYRPIISKIKQVSAEKYDIYSLGRSFYVIMNFKVFSRTGLNHFFLCNNPKYGKKLDIDYCHYFETLILLMTDPDEDKRPTVSEVLTSLREIRTKLNIHSHKLFTHFDNMLKTNTRINSHGFKESLTPYWRQKVKSAKEKNSDFYELFVLSSKNELDRLYPNSNNPIRKEFMEEHQMTLLALTQLGYLQRVII